MSSNLALSPESATIVACTVSRDVQEFDLLIEDMEGALGENWGDLTFEEAHAFLEQPEAQEMDFIAVAVDAEDEGDLVEVGTIIRTAKAAGIRVILIADGLSPTLLHSLLRDGADDFVPYPLPENALADAIARVRSVASSGERHATPTVDVAAHAPAAPKVARGSRAGTEPVLFAVHGISGGCGATTFAMNLAWEMANFSTDRPLQVCLIDLDLQFGSVATYLDLPRRGLIYEILADTQSMDEQAFRQSLVTFNEKMHVFTAPTDILPLDLIGPEDVLALIQLAKQCFDVVVVDMPHTLVSWTETVLQESDIYFANVELELRSAQNVLRMIKALRAEHLPLEKVKWVLNRTPRKIDSTTKGRIKRLSESLGVEFNYMLPDGGRQVTDTNDHGVPLAEAAPKNPMRKEILAMAEVLHAAAMGDVNDQAKPKKRSFFGFG
jgi:pilus assembly protein CpaE